MAIRVDERFVVNAPVAAVWRFLVDPRRVVTCVPGGELDGVVDERTFDGRVTVRFGRLRFAYRGRVRLGDVDEAAHRVRIVGDARERAGTGAARLELSSWLAPLPGGATEVVALTRVHVAGALVELGRGFLEQLGHDVFRHFARAVKETLEAEQAARVAGVAIAPAPRPEPLRALPLILGALRTWVAGLLRPLPAREAPVDEGRVADRERHPGGPPDGPDAERGVGDGHVADRERPLRPAARR